MNKNIKKFNYYHKGYNSNCGDNFTLYMYIKNKIFLNIFFYGNGCSISVNSAQLMIKLFKNNNIYKNLEIYKYLKKNIFNHYYINKKFNKINKYFFLKKNPSRIKCMFLIWNIFFYFIKNEIYK